MRGLPARPVSRFSSLVSLPPPRTLMPITVRVSGSLKERIAPDLTLDGVRSVGEAVARLSLPEDMGLVIIVNGKLSQWQTELHDGDVLQLAPVIGGG